MKMPVKWSRKTAAAATVAAIVIGIALTQSVESVRWRTRLVALKAAGQMPDLSWGEILWLLPPSSGVNLKPVVASRNPYTALLNPRTSARDIQAGGELFKQQCAQCHGEDGKGEMGPDLTLGRFIHGASDWALFRTIRYGIPGTAMQERSVDADAVWQLVAFTNHLAAESAGGAAGAAGARAAVAPVTFEQLVSGNRDSSNWLTYSGAYDGQRYSRLAQIRRENVGGLAVKWLFQLPTNSQLVENSPIVTGNVMFVSMPPGDVWALDTRTGALLWEYRGAPAPPDLKISVTPVSRGLAILGTTLFVARIDAQLVALDATTGKEKWKTQVADYREGYTMTGAPLALRDVIVVGVGGGELGIRGFLDAYSASDGKRVWRFHTVPGPGEAGHDTWGGGTAWEKGAAPTWLTGSYDPELDLVYWGVGNPGPDYQGDVRPGDNLYSNSVVALEGKTGKLRWHFQFTPHDEHDWDAAQIPVLVDRTFRGQPRKLMYWANRNGFYYVLDRVTGEFLHGHPFVKQTWAERLDERGRPIQLPSARPTRGGVVVYPSWLGATNWWSPAYDPGSDLFFVAAREGASVFTNSDVAAGPDGSYTASSGRPAGPAQCSIQALVGSTGERQWLRPIADVQPLGGLVATAGGLVFGSDAATFLALDVANGNQLWRLNTGGTIHAAPVTYLADGQQQVTVVAGRTIVTLSVGGK
jgi:alcohol dehydrogenase (cytochrome c)